MMLRRLFVFTALVTTQLMSALLWSLSIDGGANTLWKPPEGLQPVIVQLAPKRRGKPGNL